MEAVLDFDLLKSRLAGCYVTVPTPFEDSAGFPINFAALRQYIRFLLQGGLNADYATLLSGGAAGDFSTMTFDERLKVAETITDEQRPELKAFMADLCWIENIGARGFAALAKKAPTPTIAEIYRYFHAEEQRHAEGEERRAGER